MTHFEAYHWEDHVPRAGPALPDAVGGSTSAGALAVPATVSVRSEPRSDPAVAGFVSRGAAASRAAVDATCGRAAAVSSRSNGDA